MGMLALSGIIFLFIHYLPSTPLRSRAIAAIGESAYLGIYSVVSLFIFIWWANSFNNTPGYAPLWFYPDWWPWVKAALLLFAAVLFVGSLSSPNPSVPKGGTLLERADIGEGIFAITRHPGMWAFAIWALAHLISQPNARGFWFFGLFALTALGGAWLQDRRKRQELGANWARFEEKTSFLPFVAAAQGRAKLSLSKIGWWRIGVAILIWAAILHLHVWLFGASPLPGLAG
ncbi:MAG: NnrU family protein [Hyphomicrobiales bacterium]|nr:NnrU family protein [Hyphomicrobiales bacterium]